MNPRTLSLTEYEPTTFSATEMSDGEGLALWRQYSKEMKVEFRTPATNQEWRLTSQGWVGFLPVTPDFAIHIQPRVKLGKLFEMLNYAYPQSFKFLPGLTNCESLGGFFQILVSILAGRVALRVRKGLYREYVSLSDRSPVIRGRVDLQSQARQPWTVDVDCDFDEHTADLEENQILTWTLWRAARTGLCDAPVLHDIRKVLRVLLSVVSLIPKTPNNCLLRRYHRLNEDYRPLHALCRLILDNIGPSHEVGQHQMVPFKVRMSHLFELFVGEWLKAKLGPNKLICKLQEKVELSDSDGLVFKIDIVVNDSVTGTTKYVVDTKYKIPESPSQADINQAVTYATLKNCSHAVLVYPQRLARPLDVRIGPIRVRSLTFGIDGDLREGGNRFLAELLDRDK